MEIRPQVEVVNCTVLELGVGLNYGMKSAKDNFDTFGLS